jgi:hypothetical protein
MRTCAIAIGTLLIFASPAHAEPAKRNAARPAAEQPRPRDVVLASADTVRTAPAASSQTVPAPAKRVIPRVTTCRCGDPQPDSQNQEQ